MLPLGEGLGLRGNPVADVVPGLVAVLAQSDRRPQVQLDVLEVPPDVLRPFPDVVDLPGRELLVGAAHQDDAVGDPAGHLQDLRLVGGDENRMRPVAITRW